MEKRWTGPDALIIKGLNIGTLDLTRNNWGHQVRLHVKFYVYNII